MFENLETIVFQVTTRCPYQCPQCYMEHGDECMPLGFAKEVIDFGYDRGARMIQITGGEPMLYEDLNALIEYATAKGMYSALATSGHGAKHEVYRKFRQNGLTAICMSINDIGKTNNAKSRQMYEESLQAIRVANDCGLCCFANIVVSDDNISRLVCLGEHLLQLGVQGINLLRAVPSFDKKYIPVISKKTIEQLAEIVIKCPDLYVVERCFGEYWSYVKKQDFICKDLGKTTFFVNADSTFSLCSKNNTVRYSSIEQMMRSVDCSLPHQMCNAHEQKII